MGFNLGKASTLSLDWAQQSTEFRAVRCLYANLMLMDTPETNADPPPEASTEPLPKLTDVEAREVAAYNLLLKASLQIADEAYKLPEEDERRNLLESLAISIREMADYIWNCIDAEARETWFFAIDSLHGILDEPRLGQPPRRKHPPTNSLTERQLQFILEYAKRHRQLWFLYYLAEAGFSSADAFYNARGPVETDRYGGERRMAGPSPAKIHQWIETGEMESTVMLKLTRKLKANMPEGLFYLTDIPVNMIVEDDTEASPDVDGQEEANRE